MSRSSSGLRCYCTLSLVEPLRAADSCTGAGIRSCSATPRPSAAHRGGLHCHWLRLELQRPRLRRASRFAQQCSGQLGPKQVLVGGRESRRLARHRLLLGDRGWPVPPAGGHGPSPDAQATASSATPDGAALSCRHHGHREASDGENCWCEDEGDRATHDAPHDERQPDDAQHDPDRQSRLFHLPAFRHDAQPHTANATPPIVKPTGPPATAVTHAKPRFAAHCVIFACCSGVGFGAPV